MATEALKILGQAQPGTADTLIYTVPGGTEAVVNITVSNNTATKRTYRLAATNTGSTPVVANGEYFAFDADLVPGDVHVYEGITLAATDRVYARCDVAASISVGVFGVEAVD